MLVRKPNAFKTVGQAKLVRALGRYPNLSQAAADVGLPAEQLNRWARGRKSPNLANAITLQAKFKIKVQDWITVYEKEQIAS